MMNQKQSRENAKKQKLRRLSSEINVDEEDYFGLHDIKKEDGVSSNWRFATLGCGSNAFGQVCCDETMSSTLHHIVIPVNNKQAKCDIEQISAGSTISSAVLSKGGGLFFWGSSGTSSYRTPLPMKIDPRCVVKQISCGESHSAFISQTGKVFTVGNGDHGALGHGNKTTLTSPKLVTSLAKLICLQVSCGPYHTGFIAGEEGEIGFVRIPPSSSSILEEYEYEDNSGGRFDRVHDGSLLCGRLFMCGVGKAGQLGMGDTNNQNAMLKSPREVKWFSDNGHRVGKVSCGMHHTAVITIPVSAIRMFTTSVFTFGWGEHGRLGHGNENSAKLPQEVKFPEPFHAIDVSAGDQHTLATSGRENGCYAWGNNSFGQCAAGSPSAAEYVTSPNKIPIPDGIRIIKITAGGRHSAAISACGKLLMWGWGEEGQLGNGSEKDSWLPRPVRLPEVAGQKCIPVTVSLGTCHTLVAVRNKNYVHNPVVEEIEVEEEEVVLKESFCLPVVSIVADVDTSNVMTSLVSPAPPLTENVTKKQSVIVVEDNIEEGKPVQSLKDILACREERDNNRQLETVLGRYGSAPEPEPEPELEPQLEPEVLKSVAEGEEEEEQVEKEATEDDEFNIETEEKDLDASRQPSSTKDRNFDKYYYKEGQDLEKCYVANSARRAELRKQKKAAPPPPVPPSTNKKGMRPRRGSK